MLAEASPVPCALVVAHALARRTALDEALAGAGFSVTSCGTAGFARDAIAEEHFDILVLDGELPDDAAAVLVSELRGNPKTRSTCVLLLSAKADRPFGRGVAPDVVSPSGAPASEIASRARELVQSRRVARATQRVRAPSSGSLMAAKAPAGPAAPGVGDSATPRRHPPGAPAAAGQLLRA